MKPLGIRARVLAAAILPVTVVAILLAAVFMVAVVNDLDEAHRQRALALARQIASTSEFALFTGNEAALRAVVTAAQRQQDVSSAAVLDRAGVLIVSTQPSAVDRTLLPSGAEETRELGDKMRRIVIQTIAASELPVESLFDQAAGGRTAERIVLGYVVLEVSRAALLEAEAALVIAGTLVTLLGLLFGCVLAVRLSRGVTAPVLRVIDTVEGYGRGDLAARLRVDPTGPLRALEEGINRMAARIEQDRDDLERRVAEATRELRAKKDEAERANTAKSRFLAAASHDLRQPVHALRLFADSLRDEVAGHPRAEILLGRIQASIDATSAMFDALLDISKLEAGVIVRNVSDFPVQTLLARLETMFTPVAVERGLRYSVVASRAWVRSDPALLDRVLQNLVSNALKYTREGGVVVGCRRRRGCVSIEVWDTGPGIAPEHRDEIFQEFVQLDNPARDSGRGLGLGLAIVERIARLLEHPLNLRSTPGRGSVFAVEVPRALPAPVQEPPVQAPAEAAFHGVRVGVIDDEAAIRDAMEELLGRWGCTVSAAASAAELLGRLKRDKRGIDLLVCDYRLEGGGSGLDAVEQVRRAMRRPVPAVFVTADTAADRLKEAHASGYELLHKPVSPAKLRQVMHRMLARRAAGPGTT